MVRRLQMRFDRTGFVAAYVFWYSRSCRAQLKYSRRINQLSQTCFYCLGDMIWPWPLARLPLLLQFASFLTHTVFNGQSAACCKRWTKPILKLGYVTRLTGDATLAEAQALSKENIVADRLDLQALSFVRHCWGPRQGTFWYAGVKSNGVPCQPPGIRLLWSSI